MGEVAVQPEEPIAVVAQIEDAVDLDGLFIGRGLTRATLGRVPIAVAATPPTPTVARLALRLASLAIVTRRGIVLTVAGIVGG